MALTLRLESRAKRSVCAVSLCACRPTDRPTHTHTHKSQRDQVTMHSKHSKASSSRVAAACLLSTRPQVRKATRDAEPPVAFPTHSSSLAQPTQRSNAVRCDRRRAPAAAHIDPNLITPSHARAVDSKSKAAASSITIKRNLTARHRSSSFINTLVSRKHVRLFASEMLAFYVLVPGRTSTVEVGRFSEKY